MQAEREEEARRARWAQEEGEEHREEEVEESAHCAAPVQSAEQMAEETTLAVWATAFSWAGQPPVFIDLTGPAEDDNAAA